MSHGKTLGRWSHEHSFGQEKERPGERRTRSVIAITAAMMLVEVAAGLAFGSMALLADGLHMASHAAALGISALAYRFTRRHAHDPRFNFGTGKLNSLAAFASAVLLSAFAAVMAWESVVRLWRPVAISFDSALLVAVLGLAVNGVCLLVLRGEDHDHDHGEHHHHHDHHEHQDHNLWSAYLHVLADALTSVLAIVALLAGKKLGWVWLDAAMGLAGALLVARWSRELILSSSRVLLDMRPPEELTAAVRRAIEAHGGDKLADLHLWAVGPGIYSAALSVVSSQPKGPRHYRELIPESLGLVHVTVEVHRCED